MGVVWGADFTSSGFVLASSAIRRITSMKASSVSFDSFSVGSIMRLSWKSNGKYIVGA